VLDGGENFACGVARGKLLDNVVHAGRRGANGQGVGHCSSFAFSSLRVARGPAARNPFSANALADGNDLPVPAGQTGRS